MVNGIDVSDYQPNVDWHTVKEAGYSFAYTKATEGTSFVAETLAHNIKAMKTVGMLPGVYHFYNFNDDPVAQARHFLKAAEQAGGLHQCLPPALDLEAPTRSPHQAVADVAKFLGIVEHVVGTKMVLYMAWGWWTDAFGASDGFTGHPLWVAQYEEVTEPGRGPSQFPWLKGWDWTFWQYSQNKYVAGAGVVDADWFHGTIEQLHAFCLK